MNLSDKNWRNLIIWSMYIKQLLYDAIDIYKMFIDLSRRLYVPISSDTQSSRKSYKILIRFI